MKLKKYGGLMMVTLLWLSSIPAQARQPIALWNNDPGYCNTEATSWGKNDNTDTAEIHVFGARTQSLYMSSNGALNTPCNTDWRNFVAVYNIGTGDLVTKLFYGSVIAEGVTSTYGEFVHTQVRSRNTVSTGYKDTSDLISVNQLTNGNSLLVIL